MGLREIDDAVVAALLAEVRTSREHFDSGTDLLRVASGQISILKEDIIRLIEVTNSKASALELAAIRAAVEKVEENCERIQNDKVERCRAEIAERTVHHRGLWALAATLIAAAVTGVVELVKHIASK
jgi:hypothetical protein